MALAKEVTRLVHGEAGLQSAERITEAMFTNRIGILAEEDLRQLSLDGLPSTRVATAEAGLAELLVESGLAVTPRGEVTLGQAKKLIKSKAVSVNGEKTDDIAAVLSPQTALFGCFHILQRGKKNHHLVEWIDVK
jgi:tyrosyl-tRNA synthetase